MKKLILTATVAATFAMGMIMLIGCGEASKQHAKKAEHTENDEHTEHEKSDHDHGEHSHAGDDHMDHMKDIRAWLKKELGDEYDAVVPDATEEQLTLGKTKYDLICAACHGTGGKGDGAAAAALEDKPADFTDVGHSKYYSDAGRIHIITKGSPGTAMVAWESTLSEEEIQAVYMYVRSLRADDEDDNDHGDGMYTCSMHPEVSGNKGGECPKCGMDLITKDHAQDDGHGHQH